MKKWVAGIFTTVLTGIIIWWITKPPTEVSYSVSGTWRYSMTSQVSDQTSQGSISLIMDKALVSGILENTFDNSKSGVQGTYINNSLELSRDTGLETVQKFRLRKINDNTFEGEFWNIGKFPDNGTIEIER